MSIIENNENQLFNVEFGVGENSESKHEGIIYKNLYGTHLIGPTLVRNPEFLKLIVNLICTNKDKDFEYKNIDYVEEQRGYELVLSELEKRKEQIDYNERNKK